MWGTTTFKTFKWYINSQEKHTKFSQKSSFHLNFWRRHNMYLDVSKTIIFCIFHNEATLWIDSGGKKGNSVFAVKANLYNKAIQSIYRKHKTLKKLNVCTTGGNTHSEIPPFRHPTIPTFKHPTIPTRLSVSGNVRYSTDESHLSVHAFHMFHTCLQISVIKNTKSR